MLLVERSKFCLNELLAVTCRKLWQKQLRRCQVEPLLCHLAVISIELDANEFSTELLGDRQRGSTAAERIKYNVTWLGRCENARLHQLFWENREMSTTVL